MPLPVIAQVGIQVGANLGLQLLATAFDRRSGLRRHKQQFRESGRTFGELSSPEAPEPYLWGRHRRFQPQLFYAATTFYDTTVVGQTTATQPARGKRLHLAYLISRGACQRVNGIWIDGVRTDAAGQVATSDGDGMKLDLPFRGVARWRLDGDAAGLGSLRRQTLTLPTAQRFLASDTPQGFAWIYISFDAHPKALELTPETELDSYPLIELDVSGRRILIPSSANASNWSTAWTEETAAVCRDLLRTAGYTDFDDAETWTSHRVGSQQVTVSLDREYQSGNAGSRMFFAELETKPDAPVTFNPPAQWGDSVPDRAAGDGLSWWLSVRTGEPADFMWTDPIAWVYQDPSSGDQLVGAYSMSYDDESRTAGFGVDPNIGDIMIDPDDIGDVTINVPPHTPALPPGSPPEGGVSDDYRNMYEDEEESSILYPCSVLAYGDELADEQTVWSIVNRLMFNAQGAVRVHQGKLLIQSGYARSPVAGTFIDGTHGDFDTFQPAGDESQQWNTFSIDLPYAGAAAAETEIIELVDEARKLRNGGIRIPLRLGAQPYLNRRSHARRMLATTAVRRRYQRQGVFTLRPDLDGTAPEVRPGDRIVASSAHRDLESYHRDENGRIVSSPTTTFLVRGMVTRGDGSQSLQVEEDPDLNWCVYVALPNIDPDVSEPGVIIDDFTGLTLSDHVYQLEGQAWQADLIANWNPAATYSTNLRYRLTVATGETLEEMVDGVTQTRTGPYQGPWEFLTFGPGISTATIPNVRLGATYEVQGQHVDKTARAGDWSAGVSHTVTSPDALPSGGNQIPWATEIERTVRAASAVDANTSTEWFLSGGTDDWEGSRTVTIGGVNPTEEAYLKRLESGSLLSLWDDNDNWAIYVVNSEAAFGGSGSTRIAGVGLDYIQAEGQPPSSGAISVRFFPSGIDGPDLARIQAWTLSASTGMTLTWSASTTPPDMWRIQIGVPTTDGGINWSGQPSFVEGTSRQFNTGDTPLSGADPPTASVLSVILNTSDLSNRMYVRIQGLRRDGADTIAYGAATHSATITSGTDTAPGVPGLAATTIGDTTTTLTITAPSSWGTGSVSSRQYKGNSRSSGENWGTEATHAATLTTFSFTGLTAGTTYHARLKAVTDDGESAYATVTWTTTGGGTPPSGNLNVSFTAAAQSTAGNYLLNVTWDAYSGAGIYRVRYYDGTDTSGTLLRTIWDATPGQSTVVIILDDPDVAEDITVEVVAFSGTLGNPGTELSSDTDTQLVGP